MDDLFKPAEKKVGVNKVFVGGIVFALVTLAVVIGLLSTKPSMDVQTAQILDSSLREGAEFDAMNKEIIISEDGTIQSPTGMGTISMYINGKIRNRGTRTFSALEVNVAVVTQFNVVLRERKILVVPVQQPVLGPGETIPITLTIDGFAKEDDRANIRWKVTAIKEAK